MMAYEWKDKVVLITGAAGGIGAEIVKILVGSEHAKHVTILDVINDGFALENELNSKFGNEKVAFIKCDITEDDQLFAAFKSVTDKYGYIDVVINNAGIMNDSYGSYKKMVDVNVTALYTSTLKAIELMRKDEGGKGGTVINISSIAALIHTPITPMYYGTKSAVLSFTCCIGMDDYYSRTGVRLFTVCFGVTNTDLITMKKMGNFDKVIHNSLEDLVAKYPGQRPESAARGVVDAFKQAESSSTWLVTSDKPAKNITANVTKAYEILGEGILD